MELRHEGGCPNVLFAPHQATRSLKTVFHKQPDPTDSALYVIVMPRRGKARQPNMTFAIA
jgi:hypothetical protein